MIMIDIGMPEKCGECPCFHAEYPMHCQLAKPPDKSKRLTAPYGLPRPGWCPLLNVGDALEKKKKTEPEPCVFCGEKAVRKQLHFKLKPGEDVYKCEHHEDGSLKWSYLECENCGRSTSAYCYEYQSTKLWNDGKAKL